MTEALVNRIIEQSFLDGPGNRMAVFLQGCNMSCRYCHNPETQNSCTGCGECVAVCPAGALELRDGAVFYTKSRCLACDRCLSACPSFSSPKCTLMSADTLVSRIVQNKDFLDGVTFSGGECTLWHPFLLEIIKRVKAEAGLPCFLDTNGLAEEEVMGKLAEAADGFLFDLKALDPQKHRALTGADNGAVLRNLKLVSDAGLLYEVRTVLVEGVTDDAAEVEAIAAWVRDLNGYTVLRLIPFRPVGVKTELRHRPETSGTVSRRLLERVKGILGERAVLSR